MPASNNIIVCYKDSYQQQSLLHCLTAMKSQLERILTSDLSEYKIAVSEHLNSLDQFEQCLTERSMFMQNFNQMLKLQLSKINKDPSTQFQKVQINHIDKIVKKQQNAGEREKQFKVANKANSKNLDVLVKNLPQIPQYTQRLTQIKHYFRILSVQVSRMRKFIIEQVARSREMVLKDTTCYIVTLINNIDAIYNGKIKQLEGRIQKLTQQNSNLQKQCLRGCFDKKQQPFENRSNPTNPTINIFQNQDSFCKNRQRAELNFSPIWSFDRNCQLSQDRYTQQKSYLLSDRKMNQIQIKRVEECDIIRQPLEMTIKNNIQEKWKHFTCNIQNTIFKELAASETFQNKNIYNIGQPSCFSNKQNQPKMPVLLRKATSDRSFDIPLVRTLLVSNPPVDEGFSVLKLGTQTIYKGMWKARKFHGTGKLTLPQYQYEGDFQWGVFQGRGSLKIGNILFIGDFKENKADGQGKLKIGPKTISGRWKNNCLVQKY